ncbi:lipid-A-disaccharide synthase [Ferruginibacter yonginensis]|uniref:Lipid-A-disaccharide synthase n=1 Tax=Ferruginibacter yonginensis TaxID=1310416 RepID=A0ABV8QV91_9BACT
MKYYIIAGEASGDLHGSNLIKALLVNDPQAEIRCWGGDKMQASGATLVKHYKDLAFMGFIEVVKNLPTILKNLSACKKDIEVFSPDLLILIDYPGFNMRIAKWAHLKNIKVAYYISPQIWAWKENRVHAIKRDVDRMMVILPFEKDFYKKYNMEVDYVGHPLAEVINQWKAANPNIKKENIVALLPGSRKQEILVKLPIMLSVAAHFPDYKFVVAKAPGQTDAFYEALLKPYSNVDAVANKTYELLATAKAALVTSGTATLETALFGVPEVICYKGSYISYQIAKRLIKIKFIGLVNLIMNKEVVKELIQQDLNEQNLVTELQTLLHNDERKQQLQHDYASLSQLLNAGGHASSNAAAIMYNMVKN